MMTIEVDPILDTNFGLKNPADEQEFFTDAALTLGHKAVRYYDMAIATANGTAREKISRHYSSNGMPVAASFIGSDFDVSVFADNRMARKLESRARMLALQAFSRATVAEAYSILNDRPIDF